MGGKSLATVTNHTPAHAHVNYVRVRFENTIKLITVHRRAVFLFPLAI